MKIQSTVRLSQEEATKILSKIVENKLKKKIVSVDFAKLEFVLEETEHVEEQPQSKA